MSYLESFAQSGALVEYEDIETERSRSAGFVAQLCHVCVVLVVSTPALACWCKCMLVSLATQPPAHPPLDARNLIRHHWNRSEEQNKNDQHKIPKRAALRIEFGDVIQRLCADIAQPE